MNDFNSNLLSPSLDNQNISPDVITSQDNSPVSTSNPPIPINSPTSDNEDNLTQNPENNLILGKFKSQDELAKAYLEIQKQQGYQSNEIGELRKKARLVDDIQKQSQLFHERRSNAINYLDNAVHKYDHDNYFKNESFNSLFSEAFKLLGPQLDIDKFIPLLDNYVNSRIALNNKLNSAISENNTITDKMNFSPDISSPNNNHYHTSLNSLSPEDLDKALDSLI